MRKVIIAAGLVSCLALGGCTTPIADASIANASVASASPQEKETVYDRFASDDADYYDKLKKAADEAENTKQTAENTVQGTPDPQNTLHENAAWIHDSRYTSMCAEKAAECGSDTDWFAIVDVALCRATFLEQFDGSWKVVAAFDCGTGKSEKELGVSDSNQSHSFTGTFKVDHKNELLGGLKWWVCYIPCWTQDGLDDGQGFHNLYLGYTGAYSNGCVRLTDMNAKWVYDNVPVGTTVLVDNLGHQVL